MSDPVVDPDPVDPADPPTEPTPLGPQDREKRYSEAEYTALAQSFATTKAELEAKLRSWEDKDKSELDKASTRAAELSSQLEEATREIARLRIDNKFLAVNKVFWHDPETALSLLDTSGVTTEDDGTVKGLEEAIAVLAKAKPFLVKGTADQGEGKKAVPTAVSGAQPSNGKDGRLSDRAELLKKYPVLAQGRSDVVV